MDITAALESSARPSPVFSLCRHARTSCRWRCWTIPVAEHQPMAMTQSAGHGAFNGSPSSDKSSSGASRPRTNHGHQAFSSKYRKNAAV